MSLIHMIFGVTKHSAISAIGMAVMLTSIVAYAETDEDKPATDQIEDRLYESMVVTGTRLDMPSSATGLPLTLRETPQSISIVDREFVDSFALETLADVLNFAPGIQTQQAETDRFFFRARGRDITNFQFDGVPVVYDSFFSDAVTDTVIFDRVEIVRGATGLLTGAGEPSAAINLIRKRPTQEDSGYASIQAGSWNNQRIELDHSQSLTKSGTIRARFAGAYERGDSYVDLTEKKNLTLYGVLLADLSNATRLTIGFDYSDRDPTSSTWGALPLFYDNGVQADDLPRSTTTAADWTAWARDGQNAFIQLEHMFDNDWNLQVEVERRENEMDGNLLYLFGFPNQQTGLGLASFPLVYLADREQTAVRAMATGPFNLFGREHTLTAGFLHSEEENSFSSFFATSPVTIPSLFTWNGTSVPRPTFSDTPFTGEETETQTGFYAAARFSITDKATFIIGSRFSDYEFETEDDNQANDTKHNNVDTPYVGLIYDITDNISVYTSYTEIFLPQNARDASNDRLDPVEGSNIELGIKGDFFDDRLTASIAAYKVEEDNVAVPDPVNNTPLPDGSFPSIAVEGAETKGFEVEANGQLTDAVRLYFSYTHNDAENADGSDLSPYLPKDMIRVSALYDVTEAFRLGVNLNWQSDISLPLAGPNGETFEQDSYAVINLFAGYQLTPQLRLNANANNVTNEKYFSSIDFFNQGFFGAPRSYEFSVVYSW